MNFNKKFLDRMFKSVDSVVWDIMSGRVGFKTPDGITTIDLGADVTDTEAPNAEVSINMFDDFGISIPAFAQSVPSESISLGDLIFGASKPLGWVVKKNDKSFKLMKPDGTRSDWSPPKTQMIGFESGVMVLRNLMNMFPNGNDDLNQFQGSLMPLLMMGSFDGDSELKNIMPFMLMSQAQGGAANGNMMNMFLMMSMLKGGGSSGNFPSSSKGGSFFDTK